MAENRAKATIINEVTQERVTCQFNPGEYTLRKRNKWKEKPIKGKEVPELEFTGGKPGTLKMELFFDTTDDGSDVRTYTQKLWDMMKLTATNPDTGKGEPPKCLFVWNTLHFTAVIKDVNQKFIMFLPDGRPVRAKVKVTFQQVESGASSRPQNPTSLGEARKTRTVVPGDRLDLIAFQEYGDANRWYELAIENELENPMELQVGQILKIPTL